MGKIVLLRESICVILTPLDMSRHLTTILSHVLSLLARRRLIILLVQRIHRLRFVSIRLVLEPHEAFRVYYDGYFAAFEFTEVVANGLNLGWLYARLDEKLIESRVCV